MGRQPGSTERWRVAARCCSAAAVVKSDCCADSARMRALSSSSRMANCSDRVCHGGTLPSYSSACACSARWRAASSAAPPLDELKRSMARSAAPNRRSKDIYIHIRTSDRPAHSFLSSSGRGREKEIPGARLVDARSDPLGPGTTLRPRPRRAMPRPYQQQLDEAAPVLKRRSSESARLAKFVRTTSEPGAIGDRPSPLPPSPPPPPPPLSPPPPSPLQQA